MMRDFSFNLKEGLFRNLKDIFYSFPDPHFVQACLKNVFVNKVYFMASEDWIEQPNIFHFAFHTSIIV